MKAIERPSVLSRFMRALIRQEEREPLFNMKSVGNDEETQTELFGDHIWSYED